MHVVHLNRRHCQKPREEKERSSPLVRSCLATYKLELIPKPKTIRPLTLPRGRRRDRTPTMTRVLAALLFLPLALQQRSSRYDGTDTCHLEDSTVCAFSGGLFSGERDAVEALYDLVPHRISVANTSGIHFSVKTAAKYHEERLSLLLLTWLQTVEPHQVTLLSFAKSGNFLT